MKTKPVIELKNLKVAEFASEETTCYEATVYVDGARFCVASNQGQGGDDSYDAIRPRGGYKTGEEAGAARRELDADVHKIALRHNPNAIKKWPEGGFPDKSEPWEEDDAKRHAAHDLEMAESDRVTTWQVFEHLVNEALTLALYAKDMKGALSKKWIFQKESGGSLFEMKRRKGDTADRVLGVIREKTPGVVLLNALPSGEALALWMAH